MIKFKKYIFVVFILFQISIWLTGLYLMITGYGGHTPDTIGSAMATLIFVGAIPVFWAKT